MTTSIKQISKTLRIGHEIRPDFAQALKLSGKAEIAAAVRSGKFILLTLKVVARRRRTHRAKLTRDVARRCHPLIVLLLFFQRARL